MQQPPSQGTGGTTDELRSDAKQVTNKAVNRVQSELDARKGTAATQVRSVSTAIDKAAGELNDAPDWLRSAFQQGAQKIQQFADTLEQKDSRQIISQVQELARNNPGTFLAACAAAGFAASRVFKAGAPDDTSYNAGSGSVGQSSYQPQSFSDEPMFSSTEPQSRLPASAPGEFV